MAGRVIRTGPDSKILRIYMKSTQSSLARESPRHWWGVHTNRLHRMGKTGSGRKEITRSWESEPKKQTELAVLYYRLYRSYQTHPDNKLTYMFNTFWDFCKSQRILLQIFILKSTFSAEIPFLLLGTSIFHQIIMQCVTDSTFLTHKSFNDCGCFLDLTEYRMNTIPHRYYRSENFRKPRLGSGLGSNNGTPVSRSQQSM